MTLPYVFPTLLVACLFAMPAVNAQTLLYETDFSIPPYAAGDLVGQESWLETGGPAGNPVQVLATEDIQLFQGDSSQDVNHDVGQVMSSGQIWTYAFDLIVDSYSGTEFYFAHFKDVAFGFNGRLSLANPVAGGDFTFGIGDQGSDGGYTTAFATDGTLGTTYRVNVAYDYNLGTSTLTVAGFGSITSTDADPMQAMTSVAFRQTSAGNSDNASMRIDNLTVTSVPEPSSLALIGLASMFGMVRRRK